MLIHSPHSKRNARSDCGKGSSFPKAAALQALHRQGEQVTIVPVAHLARRADLSRKVWLSLVQRLNFSWNECGGVREQQTLPMSLLGVHPSWL